jgi:hypothetical protein
MRGRRLLIGLLLLATVLVDLAVLTTASVHDWPDMDWRITTVMVMVTSSLALSQVSLTATWTLFGRTGLPWRVAGVALVIAAWTAGFHVAFPEPLYDVSGVLVFLASQAALLAGVWTAARLMGVRLIDVAAEASKDRPRQFSVLSLLACLTAVAVSLGVLQYAADLQRVLNQNIDWQDAAPLFVTCVAICLVTCWAILGTGRPIRRAAIVTGLAILVGVVTYWRESGRELFSVLLFYVLQAVWIAGSCWVVRVAGYRLGRIR